ncbi:MAG: hypothetical protein IPP07_14555 [Holophagales bacterium]|nr:hypothetical protein [Holophagales bacterium]
MAGTRGLGSLGTERHGGKVPSGIEGRSFATPGPAGRETWDEPAGGDDLHADPPTAQQRAEALVREFAERPGGGVFSRILRSRVAEGLLIRIYNPASINQTVASLCGPAALLFEVATRDPETYVRYVIALYETGTGRLREIVVTAGNDLKEYDPGQNVEASDWIALASLRDSENYFFDYQDANDAFAGITLPGELEDWFRKVGYAEVVNEARVLVDETEASIQRADAFFQAGFRVCLFIHGNMLEKSTESTGSATPNHWVVQTSSVAMGLLPIGTEMVKTISLRIYTWGEGRRLVPKEGFLRLDDFLDNYYGFVAARY